MMLALFCEQVRECDRCRYLVLLVSMVWSGLVWFGWHRLVFIPGVGAGEMFNTEQLAALNIDGRLVDTSILRVV